MKKILILILALVCLFLISCGDTQGDFTDNSNNESKTEATLPTSRATEEEEISIDSMAKSVMPRLWVSMVTPKKGMKMSISRFPPNGRSAA